MVSKLAIVGLALSFVLAFNGCGKKSRTQVSYRPNNAPLVFSCSRQGDGLWTLSGGVVTQVGIFSIDQTFDTRDPYTYIVFRDRTKGTDQVFKLGTRGYVELHTVGEHTIRIEHDEEKTIIDVATVSGSFDLNVYPDSQATTRIEIGQGQPDLVVFTDRRIAVEYNSYIWNDISLPLDSIDNITYRKGMQDRALVFSWKPEVINHPAPFELTLKDSASAEKYFLDLQTALAQVAPHVQFRRSTHGPIGHWIILGISSILGLFGLTVGIRNYRRSRIAWGCLSFTIWLGSSYVALLSFTLVVTDWEVASSLFR
jgi:hypothetical protein